MTITTSNHDRRTDVEVDRCVDDGKDRPHVTDGNRRAAFVIVLAQPQGRGHQDDLDRQSRRVPGRGRRERSARRLRPAGQSQRGVRLDRGSPGERLEDLLTVLLGCRCAGGGEPPPGCPERSPSARSCRRELGTFVACGGRRSRVRVKRRWRS